MRQTHSGNIKFIGSDEGTRGERSGRNEGGKRMRDADMKVMKGRGRKRSERREGRKEGRQERKEN